MKKRRIILLTLLFIFMNSCLAIGVYRYYHNYIAGLRRFDLETKNFCLKYNNEYPNEEYRFRCTQTLEFDFEASLKNAKFFDTFSWVEDYIPFSNNFFIIFLVVAVSCYYITKYFKNNILANDLTRQKYRAIIKKLFISCWSPALVVAICYIIRLIVYYIMTGNFDYSGDGWPYEYDNVVFFFITYVLNLIFDLLIYTNISIIVSRKVHNYPLAVVLSYIIIIGIELFLEIVISGLLIGWWLKTDFGMVFNIIDFNRFSTAFGLWPPILVPLGILLITSIIIYLLYHKKENVLISCESND